MVKSLPSWLIVDGVEILASVGKCAANSDGLPNVTMGDNIIMIPVIIANLGLSSKGVGSGDIILNKYLVIITFRIVSDNHIYLELETFVTYISHRFQLEDSNHSFIYIIVIVISSHDICI